MELVEVEAVEDRTRPQGGHAVIVLRGADRLPESGRFRLQAIDAEAVPAEAHALLEQIHEPLGVRITEDGIVLEIGPGLADSAFLVPGMAIEITLVDARMRGEFLWPAVTPLARPKRRNIMTKRPVGEISAGAGAVPSTAVAPVHSAMPVPLAKPIAEVPIAHVPIAELRPAPEPSVPLATEPASLEARPRRPVVMSAARPRAPVAALEGAEPREPLAVEVRRPEPPSDVPSIPTPVAPSVEERTAPATAPVAFPVPRSAEAGSGTFQHAPARWTPANVAAVTVAALLGLQFAGLRLFDLRVAKRAEAPAVAASAPAVRASQPSIYDVLATEAVSPRGLAAEGVSPARALQLAHVYQHGPEAGRDRDEAIYWLKRYVLASTGSESSRIALTQLGSAYARPAGSGASRPDNGPDMGRAIAAWEMAAAMGDTVAMCFLSTVYERGVGVPADPAAAAAWTARATRGGGCAMTSPASAVAPR